MTFVSDLKHYNDIRRHVPFEVFRAASGYISWHNRLTMTPMLEVWEALVVALVYQRMPIDELMFGAVKSFLGRTGDSTPEAIEDCRARADQLFAALTEDR